MAHTNLGKAANTILTATEVNCLVAVNGSGQVGIGTAGPSSPLDVVKASAGDIAEFTDGTQGIFIHTGSDMAEIVGYSGAASNNVSIRATGTPGSQLWLDTGGNVGIGTSSPTNALQIPTDGTASAVNIGTDVGVFIYTQGGDNSNISFDSEVVASGWISRSSNSNFRIQKNATNLAIDYAIQTAGAAPGFSNAMTFLNDGNVGIGTTSPDDKLHVYDGDAGAITHHAFTQFIVEDSTNVSMALACPNGSNGYYAWADPTNGGLDAFIMYETGNQKMNFQTNGSVRAVIDSTGNVGIGTSSPGSMLHVSASGAGSVAQLQRTDGSSGTFHGLIKWTDSGCNQGFAIGQGQLDQAWLYVYHGGIASGNQKLAIGENGNLKINGDYTLPNSDGTSGQHLQTNGSGAVTWATPAGGGASVSARRYSGGNGYGSESNNRIIKWSTLQHSDNNTVIDADNNSTTGMAISAKVPCYMSFSYTNNFNTGSWLGISINGATTTVWTSLAAANKLSGVLTTAANELKCVTFNGFVNSGDIVRPHTNGATVGTNAVHEVLSVYAIAQ